MMRWLMEFKMMHKTKTEGLQKCVLEDDVPSRDDIDSVPQQIQANCERLGVEQELLDTINEMPENVEETEISSNDGTDRDSSITSIVTQANSLESCPGSSSQTRHEVSPPSPECSGTSSSDSNSVSTSIASQLTPSPPSAAFPSSSIIPPSKTDQDDALSADEGIQTSPPFEMDDPWDHDDQHEITVTPTKRRYSMSSTSALLRSPRRIDELGDGGNGVSLRSPTKSWLADEVKARRWRYRPKSCSLPHMDWLKQRTETALDRSAEMQRRTAELIQSAKTVRDQEV